LLGIEGRGEGVVITDIRESELAHFGCRVTADQMELKAKTLLKRKVFRQATWAAPFAPAERTRLAREALAEGRTAKALGRAATHTGAQLAALAQAKIAFCQSLDDLRPRSEKGRSTK
jgi:hypothetical protein